ncbi:MAG: hypothetical protein PWQ79_128 [Thermococcaceae archaeon]|nr:hypothetical protein [Thermococcaceae archaeon]MDK2913213.1 hypothetical protein [Thermococcaceae archaeon]
MERLEVKNLIENAINEMREDGLEPDIFLVGPDFLESCKEVLREYASKLKIYKIDELGYDAVLADSSYLGQLRKASRRISIEPLVEEKERWEELQKLEV